MKEKKHFKKITAILLAILVAFPMFQVNAETVPEAVQIQEIEYSNGMINVEFCDMVNFRSDFTVTIKDEGNRIYTPQNVVKGTEDLQINIGKLPVNKNIVVTIDGIKYFDETQYGSVSGSFKTDSENISIKKIEVKNSGQVDITFHSKVKYRKAKVRVFDQNKREYSATLKYNNGYVCSIFAKDMRDNTNYTFEISGIRTKGSTEYGTAVGAFFLPKKETPSTPKPVTSIKIDEIDFEEGVLNIEFRGRVSWNKPQIKITNKAGKVFEAEMIYYDSDECSVVVEGLKEYETYFYELTGIKSTKDKAFGTITGKFYVDRDDDDDDDDDDDHDDWD